MSSGLSLDQLGSTIKAHISIAEKYEGKQLENYKSAGLHLQEAKRRVESGEYEGKNFSHYCSTYAQISVSRAYELVAIADGRTTVEAVKAGNNERYHKSQAEKKFRESTEKHQPTDSAGKNVKQPNNLGGRPVAGELSHLRSLIGKKSKMKNKEQLLLIIQFMDGV